MRYEQDGRVGVLYPVGDDSASGMATHVPGEQGNAVTYVPGELLEVQPERRRARGGTPHLTGRVVRRQVGARRLGLEPLRLFERDVWDPRERIAPDELDAELENDPELATVYRAGPRPVFEMELVLPAASSDDPWDDPIDRAVETYEAGDVRRAARILGACLEADLRCLDAHAHLGKFAFEGGPGMVPTALRHYRVGVAIGDLSLGESFAGLLPWGYLDNRPYLRCLHGLGLAWWRLGEPGRARDAFRRLLWLDPEDHVGARFCLADIGRGFTWEQASFVEEAAQAAWGGVALRPEQAEPGADS